MEICCLKKNSLYASLHFFSEKQKKVTDVKAKVEEDITNEEDADIIKDDETKIKTESETVLPNRNKQARLIVRNLSFKVTVPIRLSFADDTSIKTYYYLLINFYLNFVILGNRG